jgi:dTDP-4-dehydrorhamnose reductase
VHVADLVAAQWELVTSDTPGVLYLAGPDAISRYELGTRIRGTRAFLRVGPGRAAAERSPAAPPPEPPTVTGP